MDFTPVKNSKGSLHFVAHPGGAPANVAAGIAKLGGKARYFGRLSSDPLGRLIARTLEETGVDTSQLPESSHKATALAVVSLNKHGNREFTFYHDGTADICISPEDVPSNLFDGVSICHFGSFALSVPQSASVMKRIMKDAENANCLISSDLNVRASLWKSGRKLSSSLRFLAGRSNVLKCSIEELGYLDQQRSPTETAFRDRRKTRRRIEELAQNIFDTGPELLVVTMGRGGAAILARDRRVFLGSFNITPVDTTGAGDAFFSSMLYCLASHGYDSRKRLRRMDEDDMRRFGIFSSAAAALSCLHYGGMESFGTETEVNHFMKAHRMRA